MATAEQIAVGVASFLPLVIAGPMGGPYTSMEFASKKRGGRGEAAWVVYAIQFLWCFTRLAAGLGLWFFLLTDFSSFFYAVAIWTLATVYIVLDWYGWPRFYFYSESKNYVNIGLAIMALGWLCLLAATILVVVKYASVTTLAFFWTGFSLLSAAVLSELILFVMLIWGQLDTVGPTAGLRLQQQQQRR
jgi:hypothetical protein